MVVLRADPNETVWFLLIDSFEGLVRTSCKLTPFLRENNKE